MVIGVSKDQMVEVDRIAPENYGLTISRMMENAGYQIADFIRQKYSRSSKIAFYAGKGNNGGDALVAARRLFSWGFDVEVVLRSDLDGIRKEEEEILKKLGIDFVENANSPDVVVDGLIGYNLKGDPRPPFDEMIEEMNGLGAELISIDVPSGFDLETEDLLAPAVRADKVLTLAAPFSALNSLDSEIWLVDISIPEQVYREANVDIDPGELFSEDSFVKVTS